MMQASKKVSVLSSFFGEENRFLKLQGLAV